MKHLKETMKEILLEKNNQLCIYITYDISHYTSIFPKDLVTGQYASIILQHRYWNLVIKDDGFGVTLDFFAQNHNIYVPFDAIVLFTEQTSNFLLNFKGILPKEMGESQKDEKIIFLDFVNNSPQ